MDSTGELITVLEYIGPDLDYLASCEPIERAFVLDPPPGPGIWMWEGKLYRSASEEHYEYELRGSYGPLTVQEAKQSMSGDAPWDPDLWYDRPPITASLPPPEPAPKPIRDSLWGENEPVDGSGRNLRENADWYAKELNLNENQRALLLHEFRNALLPDYLRNPTRGVERVMKILDAIGRR
jgi:hypothetical protein